jgi:Flp pilus assembly pilin Flp
MAEYAVVLTVIILAVIASLTLFSEAVAAGLSDVGNVIKGLA